MPRNCREAWKDLIQDPGICEYGKIVFRDKLPVEEHKVLQSSDICMGFYCEYQIQAISCRAFYWCSFSVAISVIIVYDSKTFDVATGFTVGAYLLVCLRYF